MGFRAGSGVVSSRCHGQLCNPPWVLLAFHASVVSVVRFTFARILVKAKPKASRTVWCLKAFADVRYWKPDKP